MIGSRSASRNAPLPPVEATIQDELPAPATSRDRDGKETASRGCAPAIAGISSLSGLRRDGRSRPKSAPSNHPSERPESRSRTSGIDGTAELAVPSIRRSGGGQAAIPPIFQLSIVLQQVVVIRLHRVAGAILRQADPLLVVLRQDRLRQRRGEPEIPREIDLGVVLEIGVEELLGARLVARVLRDAKAEHLRGDRATREGDLDRDSASGPHPDGAGARTHPRELPGGRRCGRLPGAVRGAA